MTDRLYRSRSDRMLAGVAGGLAEMWDVDPSIVRIVWAVLAVFSGGLALVLYIVMAIVVPDEDDVYSWPSGSPGTAAPGEPLATTGPTGPTEATGSAPAAASGWVSPSTAPSLEARRDQHAAREAARAERRAARAATGGGRGGLDVALVIGALFVLLGSYLLVRQWWPAFDLDWFWPLSLVVIGVALVAVALTGGRGRNKGTSA